MAVLLRTSAREAIEGGLLDRWREVPVAVAVDLGPDLGRIDPAIRPLLPPGRQPRLFGRAVTALCEPPDFGAVLHAIDLLAPGDVLVIAAAGRPDVAMIGEILGGQARRRGATGLVCDGAVRDVAAFAAFGDFAVFSRSITPRGPSSATNGVVNGPVVVGGVPVAPGDLVLGDDDGLCTVTPAAAASRIGDAEAKLAKERVWLESFGAGRSVRETFGLAVPETAGS